MLLADRDCVRIGAAVAYSATQREVSDEIDTRSFVPLHQQPPDGPAQDVRAGAQGIARRAAPPTSLAALPQKQKVVALRTG
jgi:hypothetical protein